MRKPPTRGWDKMASTAEKLVMLNDEIERLRDVVREHYAEIERLEYLCKALMCLQNTSLIAWQNAKIAWLRSLLEKYQAANYEDRDLYAETKDVLQRVDIP